MSLKCLVGIHEWVGCKCSRCGRTRDEGHDWSKDCEKCTRCGADRASTHKWEGCKCAQCGQTRDEGHDWSKDCEKCAKCAKTRRDGHDWSVDPGKCGGCGKIRFSASDTSGRKCSCGTEYCGTTLFDESTVEFLECPKCGNGTLYFNGEIVNLSGPEMAEKYLAKHKLLLGYFGGTHTSSTIVENFGYIAEGVSKFGCRDILLVFSNTKVSEVPRFDEIIEGSSRYVLPAYARTVREGFGGKKIAIVTSSNPNKLLAFSDLAQCLARSGSQSMKLFESVRPAYAWLKH